MPENITSIGFSHVIHAYMASLHVASLVVDDSQPRLLGHIFLQQNQSYPLVTFPSELCYTRNGLLCKPWKGWILANTLWTNSWKLANIIDENDYIGIWDKYERLIWMKSDNETNNFFLIYQVFTILVWRIFSLLRFFSSQYFLAMKPIKALVLAAGVKQTV